MRIRLDDERLSPTERLVLTQVHERLRGPPRPPLGRAHEESLALAFGDREEPEVIQIRDKR
jgi:hypothetical protein